MSGLEALRCWHPPRVTSVSSYAFAAWVGSCKLHWGRHLHIFLSIPKPHPQLIVAQTNLILVAPSMMGAN